jgi:8-oxo-dGTP pyrophosphatase MutT (NUDIX family)
MAFQMGGHGREWAGMVIVKHSTASVFLMGWVEREWRLGLVWHPRFARWMLPGGHVEADENPAQAALREVMEETGVDAAILPARVAVAAPADVPGMVAAPLWIVEEQVPPEPRLPRAHVHVDCLYAAFASQPKPAAVGAHRFAWHSPQRLGQLEMFDDSRALASAVLAGREALLDGIW